MCHYYYVTKQGKIDNYKLCGIKLFLNKMVFSGFSKYVVAPISFDLISYLNKLLIKIKGLMKVSSNGFQDSNY